MNTPESTASGRSTGMTKILTVAWREFKYTALTKAFVFGAIILPMVIWAVIAVMPLLISREPPPLTGTIAIVDESGLVSAEAEKAFRAAAERSKDTVGDAIAIVGAAQSGDIAAMQGMAEPIGTVNITVEGTTDPTAAEALRERVRSNELLGVAVIDPQLLTDQPQNATLELLVQSTSSPKHTTMYERILRSATVKARVALTGGNYEQLSAMLKNPVMDTQRVARGGGTAKESVVARIFVPFGFMLLLWISVFSSGQYLLTTTIEEKSNKVMEVLLSAVSPMQLLAGKILGQALVSAVLIGVYGVVAMSGLALLSMADLVPPMLLVYLVIYYVMAYFMVATMMAAVGSAVSDLREAQALVTPAMLVLMVPMILWMPISDSPNGMLAVVTSFIPPVIPFVMILRLAASEPIPMWQTMLSLVIGFASMFVMLWAAARIFRVGVLMQGKPPSPLELLKWIHYQ
ncbi:MAG: ABC transporter permease [Phycisphaerae bacterium]|nr:ABC transporter permease [Phycisphaerae bacterium]